MSKLYAIRQTGKSNYWYDFVEDFTSSELDRNCISNNFAYVKECQNTLGDLNPAWNNSEIVEFRELGEKDDFEDLYYKSLEQRADLEAKLAENEKKIEKAKRTAYSHRQISDDIKIRALKTDVTNKENRIKELKQQLAEKDKKIMELEYEKILSENKPAFCKLSGKDCEVLGKLEELKQQLAESEAYIQGNVPKLIEANKMMSKQLAEKDEEAQEIYEMYNQERKKNWLYNRKNQDKISFAVDKLTEVKEFFLKEHRNEEMDTDYIITKDAWQIAEYLLNQIKRLKEMK